MRCHLVLLVPLGKIERQGIDAVAQACRLRSIGKYMPEMAAATTAQRLRPHHTVAGVALFRHTVLGDGLPETRPATARVKFFC